MMLPLILINTLIDATLYNLVQKQ